MDAHKSAIGRSVKAEARDICQLNEFAHCFILFWLFCNNCFDSAHTIQAVSVKHTYQSLSGVCCIKHAWGVVSNDRQRKRLSQSTNPLEPATRSDTLIYQLSSSYCDNQPVVSNSCRKVKNCLD